MKTIITVGTVALLAALFITLPNDAFWWLTWEMLKVAFRRFCLGIIWIIA